MRNLISELGVLAVLLAVCGCGPSSTAPPTKVVGSATVPASRPDPALIEQATCQGKYGSLLHALECPEDAKEFGPLFEFGYWTGFSRAKQNNLKPGYWVYAEPFWFIWGMSSDPSPLEGRKPPLPQTTPPTPVATTDMRLPPANEMGLPSYRATGWMWSSDGRWLVVEHNAFIEDRYPSAMLATWDMSTKQQAHEPVRFLRLRWPLPEGRGFACYNEKARCLELFAVPSAETTKSPSGIPSENWYRWAASPDGRFILNYGKGQVKVFDTVRGDILHEFDFSNQMATAFTTDGQYLAVQTSLFSVPLFDTKTWRQIADCKHPAPFARWALSPDARWLASSHFVEHYQPRSRGSRRDEERAPSDHYLSLWDAQRGTRQLTPLTCVKRAPVLGLAFSPDSAVLMLADWRGLEFWDVVNSTLIARPNNFLEMDFVREHFVWMSFSPDGRHFALGTPSGTRVWPAEEILRRRDAAESEK